MAEVIWTEPALADVRRILEFIADDSPRYAAITADRIMKSVDRLINFPESGHAVPEFPNSHYRQVLMNPYRVIHRYEPATDCVFILTVVHSRRDIANNDLA